MTDVLIGAVLLAIGAMLIFAALPDKNLESPRFLRFYMSVQEWSPLGSRTLRSCLFTSSGSLSPPLDPCALLVRDGM